MQDFEAYLTAASCNLSVEEFAQREEDMNEIHDEIVLLQEHILDTRYFESLLDNVYTELGMSRDEF